jgi:hypothetical protein
VNKLPVPLLENVKAIFDTGTTLILGDPTGIEDLFAFFPGAEPVPNSSGYYSSAWLISLPIGRRSNIYFDFFFKSHSPVRLRYSRLRLCWMEGNQDFP